MDGLCAAWTQVRDIRLIRDQRSHKSKGVGYVEFSDAASVLNALALNGIAFKGQPLLVQASMAMLVCAESRPPRSLALTPPS